MTKFFSKQAVLTLALLLFSAFWGSALAQNAGDYRTNGNVTFASSTNWQRYNGTSWVAATVAPTSADGKILIIGPHTAQVTSNVTLDQLTVDGILQFSNGFILTLADGIGDDLFVRNRLVFGHTGKIVGTGQLVLGNQAIVETANANGVAGSITSTNPILTTGASYWFNGFVIAQNTGFTGFINLGNPSHLNFTNPNGITIDRNLTITGTLTAAKGVPITVGAGVTNFTANAIYSGSRFNNCVGATITPAFTSANWASPKGVYQSPDSSEPTTESSNIWTNSHKTTAHIYWLKSGSGNNRMVVLKAGSPINPNAPIDNTNYTPNAVFGGGTAIDGGFVVYNGAGSQVNVTGLTEGVTYHVAVFEYNQDCTGGHNYKIGMPLTTSFKTEERPFITEWVTDDGTLIIPIHGGSTYNYTVSYRELPAGIPTVLTGQTRNCTISGLTNNVTYEISITGQFPRIYFGGSPVINAAKIRNIKQWGSIRWGSMEQAFGVASGFGCKNLNSNATDVPNLSNVTSLGSMFRECSIFNGDNVANWNTQNVTKMDNMFSNANAFNQPIGNWNTSAVYDMEGLFGGTNVFNQNISAWNTQSVGNMRFMFQYARNFNQNIGVFNTSFVTTMHNMFAGTPFNQNISAWNTAAVTTMQEMFAETTSFNQNISTWNTGSVSNMSGMFREANSFNQNIGRWNITSLNMAMDLLSNCGMSKANYDATLIGWAAQDVQRVHFTATNIRYCEGQTARNILIAKGWIIQRDIFNCPASISGNVYADMNANCTKQAGEINLKGLVVKASPGDYYGMTDEYGNYKIGIAVGNYQVEVLPQNSIGSTHTITTVCPPKPATVSAGTPNVTNIDFGAKAKVCSQLSVAVSVNRFRRCFEGNTYITYKNTGLTAVNNVVVKVELPADIEAISSVPAWTSQVGNILTYNLNTVAGQSNGGIVLKHRVSCADESIRGQARCIKATISPASYCLPTVSPTWDNADLTASSTCIDKRLGRFTIKNTGTGAMTDSSNYRIFFDEVIVKTGKVKLQASQETLIDVTHSGQVIRIEVEQTPQHPIGTSAMTFMNRCGAVALSAAPIQALPKLDSVSTGSACETIRDSYDPNDKQIMPAGVTAQKIVEKDQELEFQIRFQNEGNDDAYTVVVRDTLDPNLDLATIRTISTSHNSTVSMEGAGRGVVIWTFNNINLPAKSVNEAGSIGMITFRIRMKPNLPVGTVIKNKGHIYFDFNSAIITNETVIKIGSLPTDFGNPVNNNTIFPCPANPSVAVAGANQNISTTNTTLAATPVVKGYGKWSVVQGTATFSDEFSPTTTVTNLSTGLNILKWTSYLCNNTSESQVQITVAAACPTISLTPATLNNGTVGTNYSQTVTQTGGVGAITYSISTGTLPNGLTLNGATGEISGTPTVANTFNFTVEAKDVNNCVGTKAYSVVIAVPPCPTITVSPNNLNNGTVGTNYSQTITQTGGVGAITYSISTGTLPNGLTLNGATGEISGTPTVANTFNFTVQAKDVNNCVGTKVYSVVISVPPCATISVSPATLNNGTVGTNYSQTITQTGGVGAITYLISAGTLPTGLTLNGATGVISGTPTVANTFNFTVEAKDVNNCIGTKAYSVVITSTPVPPPPPPALLAQSINFEVIADKLFGDTDFQLVAQASSGLPVTFELVSGNVILFGNTVKINGVGSVTIRAIQKGNSVYSAATPILRTFTINKASQTLSFAALEDRIWNSGSFNVTASSSSGLPITYVVTAGQNIAKVTGSLVELLPAVGTVTITATQTGNENYTAIAASRTFNVLKVPQNQHIITVNNLPLQVSYGSKASFAAFANSNLLVKVEIIEGSAIISNNQIDFTKAGVVKLRFTQEGNDLWEAAKSVERTITVGKLSQTIQTTSIPSELSIESLGTIVAQSSSGLPVSMQLVSGKANLNGLTLTPTDGNKVEIELSQAGNENYEAAPNLRFVIAVKPILAIKNTSSVAACVDDFFYFNYESKGEFTLTNQFNYFLSDSKGDFTNLTVIEGFMNQATQTIRVKLPISLPGGNQYKIKVAATSPRIESNIISITLYDLPNKPIIRQEGEFLVADTQDKVQWYHAGLPIQQTGNKYKPTVEQVESKNEFYVVVQNNNGCLNISETFRNYVKPVPTGVNDEELSAKMLFYPNPTQDNLTISLSLENMKDVGIELVDVMGRTVLEKKVAVNDVNFSHTISLHDYAGGVYVLFVKVNDKIAVKKIVKQ